MIDRAEERGRLLQVLRERGKACLIAGPPGYGKTALGVESIDATAGDLADTFVFPFRVTAEAPQAHQTIPAMADELGARGFRFPHVQAWMENWKREGTHPVLIETAGAELARKIRESLEKGSIGKLKRLSRMIGALWTLVSPLKRQKITREVRKEMAGLQGPGDRAWVVVRYFARDLVSHDSRFSPLLFLDEAERVFLASESMGATPWPLALADEIERASADSPERAPVTLVMTGIGIDTEHNTLTDRRQDSDGKRHLPPRQGEPAPYKRVSLIEVPLAPLDDDAAEEVARELDVEESLLERCVRVARGCPGILVTLCQTYGRGTFPERGADSSHAAQPDGAGLEILPMEAAKLILSSMRPPLGDVARLISVLHRFDLRLLSRVTERDRTELEEIVSLLTYLKIVSHAGNGHWLMPDSLRFVIQADFAYEQPDRQRSISRMLSDLAREESNTAPEELSSEPLADAWRYHFESRPETMSDLVMGRVRDPCYPLRDSELSRTIARLNASGRVDLMVELLRLALERVVAAMPEETAALWALRYELGSHLHRVGSIREADRFLEDALTEANQLPSKCWPHTAVPTLDRLAQVREAKGLTIGEDSAADLWGRILNEELWGGGSQLTDEAHASTLALSSLARMASRQADSSLVSEYLQRAFAVEGVDRFIGATRAAVMLKHMAGVHTDDTQSRRQVIQFLDNPDRELWPLSRARFFHLLGDADALLGRVVAARNNYERARTFSGQVHTAEGTPGPPELAATLLALGRLVQRERVSGRSDAKVFVRDALKRFEKMGNVGRAAECQELLAS